MLVLVFPMEARSVAAARTFLREALDDALDGHRAPSIDSTDDAVLMISELVTNAVRHARSRVRVQASVTDRTLRVEVGDDDPTLPTIANLEPDRGQYATSGRGLPIVADLADRWGITPHIDGKVIWFELHL